MPQQRKLDCPFCNHPRLTNLSYHLIRSHSISRKERKALLRKARFQFYLDNHPPIPQSDSTPVQFGNSLPKTSSLPEQTKIPNPRIPCPYDSLISYERVWGTNVPVMDYDIFKLHHPFSMLVAGPRGARKSEFVNQLLSLKHYIMTDPPERICLVLW